MIFRALKLIGFGKFQNYELKLHDGINLIYGENEAGKSTIQRFLDGTLFGFYKRSVKNRQYTSDYEKYTPWKNPNCYEGAIICEIDGRQVRLLRNFTKGNDKVQILDEITREDLTAQYYYNNILKLYDPAEQMLGISQTTFVNTLSIKQLGCVTDSNLSSEVRDHILAMLGTADMDLSLDKVLKYLDKKSGEIGTTGQRKNPLGVCIAKIEELEQELVQSNHAQDSFFELSEKLNLLNMQEQTLMKQKESLISAIENDQAVEILTKYKQAVAIKTELDGLVNSQESLAIFEKTDCKKASTALQNELVKGSIELSIKEAKQDAHMLVEEIEQNKADYAALRLKTDDDQLLEQFQVHYSKIDTLSENEKDIRILQQNLETTNKEIDSIDIKDTDKMQKDIERLQLLEQKKNEYKNNQKSSPPVLPIMGILLTVVAAILGFVINPLLFIGTLVGIMLVLAGIMKGRNNNGQKAESPTYTDIKNEISQIYMYYHLNEADGSTAIIQLLSSQKNMEYRLSQLKADAVRIAAEITAKQEKITAIQKELSTYFNMVFQDLSSDNYEDLDKAQKCVNKAKEIKSKQNVLFPKLEQIQKNILVNQNRLDAICTEISEAMQACGVINIEGLAKSIEAKQQLEKVKDAIIMQEKLLSQCLGELTFDELQETAAKIPSDITIDETQSHTAENLDQVREDLEQIRKDISLETAKKNDLEKNNRTIGEVTQALDEQNQKRADYMTEIQAITLAKEKLSEVSGNLQRDFAPQLNRQISRFVAAVTGNKYIDIFIDQEMNMKVEDSENQRMTEVSDLSSGTIDMIYIAMRIGLIDFLQGGKSDLPIIFDDSFTQIDDNRLKQILSLLSLMGNRQIIIFTCHTREKELFDEIGTKYNYIRI